LPLDSSEAVGFSVNEFLIRTFRGESVLYVVLVCRFFCVFLESPVVEIPMSGTVAATHRRFNSSLRFSNF
jgi:hypothetical protein